MRKFISLIILSLCAAGASAKINFKQIDNIKGTNITFVDNEATQDYSVTDAVFVNDGKEYKAKEIRCDIEDGVANIKFRFRKCTVFSKCKVVLTINGKKETVDINLH